MHQSVEMHKYLSYLRKHMGITW